MRVSASLRATLALLVLAFAPSAVAASSQVLATASPYNVIFPVTNTRDGNYILSIASATAAAQVGAIAFTSCRRRHGRPTHDPIHEASAPRLTWLPRR